MAKTKTKSKINIKQFLLAKGEYVAMGVAGFFMVILLLWGITKWSSAKDPTQTVKDLTNNAQRVNSGLQSTQLTEADKELAAVPAWVTTPYEFKPVPASVFPLTGPSFDPTAKPDTKKENPNVYAIGAYQVDMVRGGMKAYDITDGTDGEQRIGVIFDKRIDPLDRGKAQLLSKNLKNQFKAARQNQPPPNQPLPPGQPPGMGTMVGGGPGGRGGFMGGAYGQQGGSFETGSQRSEKAIEYITFDQLDKALEKQKVPAMTVVPLRMVTIHAEIHLKKQLEEIKRALRLQDVRAAAAWGPIYDGYEVRRRVTKSMPNGEKPVVITDWSPAPNYYDFEDKYRTLINSRKLADNFEDGYLAHFIRYEMALALPLPQLITETGVDYPPIRLKNILDTIQKLKDASKAPVELSELQIRLKKGTTRGDLYRPLTSDQTGGDAFFGSEAGGPRMPPGGPMAPMGPMGPMGPSGGRGPRGSFMQGGNPNDPSNANLSAPVELEHLLLRFVDVNVEPGKTYEYQIRLRMMNPNYKRPKEVSKPADAEVEVLFSPWTQLADSITVPTESFLYAADWSGYAKKIKDEHEKEPVLLQRLQVKDHQAVVETCTWMEQIKTGEGGKREPVGTWVVADFPVARGEYIGRKSYVKLPLWSSENRTYVLREIPDKVIPPKGGKDSPQPRGWLMDFSGNKAILVDFDGGKVQTRVSGKSVTEETATEMLVLRGDDKLVVKSSAMDENDIDRKDHVTKWEKWIKEVAARKASADGTSEFSPRPGGGGGDK